VRRTWRRHSGEMPRYWTRTCHLPPFGSPQLPGPLRVPAASVSGKPGLWMGVALRALTCCDVT